jgi:diaminopimelate epimerase
MKLKFTKMHGAGNDFVVLDGVRQRVALRPEQWRLLADRHFGVGADQLLLVEPPDGADVDFVYRIFNADGGEVEQCGNGARCFVRFVRDQGLTDRRSLRVRTLGGVIEPTLEDDGRITVGMGRPVLDPGRVPFDATGLEPRVEGEDRLWPIEVAGATRWVSVLSMGNPHAVQCVGDVDSAPVLSEGPAIERHRRFPARVNAGFMQVVDPHSIRLRVFERGAGETLACGSGACAAVVAGIRRGLLTSPVDVATRGGLLTVAWDGGPVHMTGPARSVFTGEIDLSELEAPAPQRAAGASTHVEDQR